MVTFEHGDRAKIVVEIPVPFALVGISTRKNNAYSKFASAKSIPVLAQFSWGVNCSGSVIPIRVVVLFPRMRVPDPSAARLCGEGCITDVQPTIPFAFDLMNVDGAVNTRPGVCLFCRESDLESGGGVPYGGRVRLLLWKVYQRYLYR